jgi:SAM-dependent methyltransferase
MCHRFLVETYGDRAGSPEAQDIMEDARSTTFGPQWEEATDCHVCGAAQWRTVGAICGRRYALCAGCGVVRLVDRVAESALGLLYGHYYKPEELTREELERQLKNPTFTHRMKRIESMRGSRQRRIFEIGCGDGNFLAFMQRAGWRVHGSEFSSETVSLVQRRHGIAITQSNATNDTPPASPYAVVAAYHVIEHVYQPSEWLRQVRTLIEPQGLLYLQTPNWDSLTHALTGLAWSSMVFPEHVYLYTPKTLSAFLGHFGFEVLSVTTWDPWHGPATAHGSLISRAKQFATGRLQWSAVLGSPGRTGTQTGKGATSQAPGLRRVSHAVLKAAGHSLARLESLVGRGAVVDLIARRVD